ncbi:MAG: hypothetical protein V4582_03925 [Pseudomonadota bacterium]
MKKFLLPIFLLLTAMFIWGAYLSPSDMHVQWDGQDVDGPFGAVLGVLAGGFALFVGAIVVALVTVILSVVLAGVGVLAIVAVALAAVVGMAALSPLMLPLLIPAGIIWFMVKRSRKNRAQAALPAPQQGLPA